MPTNHVDTNIGYRLSSLAADHINLGLDFSSAVEAWKRELLLSILNRCHGNQLAAAEQMGIHRNTLNRMLRDLGIKILHRSQHNRRPCCQKVIPISHDRTSTKRL